MSDHSKADAPDLVRIQHVLSKHPAILLAILFGSLAKGEAHFGSDLDLAVDMGRPLQQHEKMQLIAELAEALGRPVDLIDLFSAGEPLLGQIITKGKRVLGEDNRYAFMLSKHLFNQADFVPYRNRILRERRQAWLGL